jgi:hypothetical protein
MSKITCDATESAVHKYEIAGKAACLCGNNTNTNSGGALRRRETNCITPLKWANEKGCSCNSLWCRHGAHLYLVRRVSVLRLQYTLKHWWCVYSYIQIFSGLHNNFYWYISMYIYSFPIVKLILSIKSSLSIATLVFCHYFRLRNIWCFEISFH